jgi:hypothetical protein
MDKQTFLQYAIANLQMLGLIPQSKIRKFHWYVSPQIVNPQIFIINPQISTNIAQLSLKTLVQITENGARKSQMRNRSHLRKVGKSNKLFKSANLRICDLPNLFADRPPLV